MISPRWRELLDERLKEATASLGSVPGVRGLVVGGSVGRGEPWPLSDIDILPIDAAGTDAAAEIERRHAALIDWWAASGRAQTLDVGWLRFTDEEARAAIAADVGYAAERMSDPRWLHGLDKAFGGRGVADPEGLADAFARWASSVRFAPEVVAARVREWFRQAVAAREAAADAVAGGEPAPATIQMRQAARALRLVLVEGWGERLGSLGREWTLFERMAARRGAADFAERLAEVAGAGVEEACQRARSTPAWLAERIDLAYQARLAVGEAVTAAESARDQIAAFSVLLPRRRPEPWDAWVGAPDPRLEERLAALDRLMVEICPAGIGRPLGGDP
jgi:predicted nucleotidyltransferase